ncbi:MAG: plasmid pRiA4b ORF-3 family protein [Intrasporangium sp.]|uniref:plasmid pRiA4b ORF-3 family protein n=1 Tax=Intrasporangium sp. TaxID=1925024 RepID=UPI00264A365A|nr:plasmid pRiA4b ORF-3 family protein [Intrasporangium sp.]MDN5795766.1 plasmid pRiA4b ORF-3 family protein [Intrasporangium sp.]
MTGTPEPTVHGAVRPAAERPWPPPNPPVDLPEPPVEPVLLTVHVSLRHTDPEVWRRLTIPGELDLGRVHDAIQQAMGWQECHLHRFSLSENPYDMPHFVTEFDIEEQDDEGTLETEARLDQILRRPGDTLTYEYDFGDSWTHTLTLEAIGPMPDPSRPGDPAASGASRPGESGSAAYPLVCVAGERACPPEDVGGVDGYEEMAAWVRSRYDPAQQPDRGVPAEDLRGWLPDGWDPDHFDIDEANAALARLAPRDTDTALALLPRELVEVVTTLSTPARFDLDDWLAVPGWGTPPTFTPDEAAALSTPFRVMLEAVGDGLNLTTAGYLPPRVVVTICEALDPDHEWYGMGNRENQMWPVLDLRKGATRLGLIRKAKGRLTPTTTGRKIRDDPQRLLAHVVGRLTSGLNGFDRLATLLALVAAAGGRWERDFRARGPVMESVCEVLAIRGWHRQDYGGLQTADVWHATADTFGLLEEMLRAVGNRGGEADLAARVARAALGAID